MLVSILHRATGVGLALGGGAIFIWWLAAAAGGAESYADFSYWIYRASDGRPLGVIANVLARLVAIGLTWAFFLHMFNGIRHLVLDTGAGYELKTNKMGALAVIVGSVLATLLTLPIILKGVL